LYTPRSIRTKLIMQQASSSISLSLEEILLPSISRREHKGLITRHPERARITGNGKDNLQHSPIPPEPLSRYVQRATNASTCIVRPTHINNQHRGDFHRQHHLGATSRHYTCFQTGSREGGVPWFSFLLFLLSGGVGILG
jgi:hypothetical protein